MTFLNELIKSYGSIITKWTCLNDKNGENILISKMKDVSIAVEIGTHFGVSSCVMAKNCDKLYTFDVIDNSIKYEIWEKFGINNIKFYHIKDDKEKIDILNELTFDFAFIDGNHNDVIQDINGCKKCGKILLHDYNNRWNVKKQADTLLNNIEKIDEFGYWEYK